MPRSRWLEGEGRKRLLWLGYLDGTCAEVWPAKGRWYVRIMFDDQPVFDYATQEEAKKEAEEFWERLLHMATGYEWNGEFKREAEREY